LVSLEENKAVVRKMFEAINKQSLASLDKLMAPDFVLHMHGQQTQGWAVGRQVVEDEIKAFPDFHVAIEDIIAEGDKVWYLEKDTGTDSSGKKMDATSLNILRIVNGKAVEGWGGYLQKTA
jgi:ketosteroid isomerase-like protein